MEDIIFLKPVFKEAIWGGERLKNIFGYDTGGPKTGECWGISAHPNGDCEIKSGAYKGHTLSWLWKNHKELFGNCSLDRFPLLVKIIDAKSDLSIQVHPDDAYAKVHENGALGKTECWYILDCEPNTSIIVGHTAKTKEELVDRINKGQWKELLREIPIKKGDFFQIEPGTIHAIKGGTLILETQQSSDLTYRLYDYDRLQDGKPRKLHIKQCIDVIKCPYTPAKTQHEIVSYEHVTVERMISCPFYTVELQTVSGKQRMLQNAPFAMMSIIEGSGSVNNTAVKKGDHFILTSENSEYVVDGNMSLVYSRI